MRNRIKCTRHQWQLPPSEPSMAQSRLTLLSIPFQRHGNTIQRETEWKKLRIALEPTQSDGWLHLEQSCSKLALFAREARTKTNDKM